MMIFAGRQNLGFFFRTIQASGLLFGLWLVLAGGYQFFLGEFLLGAIIASLGILIFFGVIRLKAYSFQIVFFVYLSFAFTVLIDVWLPPPEPSFSFGFYTSLFLIALLLALAVGSVLLARRILFGSRRG